MFPIIEVDLSKLNNYINKDNNIKPLGKCFKFNYTTGQHELIDGRLVEADNIESISQWIEKVIRTEINKYGIYTEDESTDFGISIYKYIGTRITNLGYISSELNRQISEQLTNHKYINSIDNFSLEIEKGRTLKISFKVNLFNGNTFEKEVII